jgi:hypothetical protein
VGARRRQPRQSAAADKEQGGLSGTERVREREREREREKEGMEAERRCSAAARRDGNGFPLELGSNARRYFRLRLSEASRKPTGLLFLTVTFSPGTEGDEEIFATFSSRPRRWWWASSVVTAFAL